MKETGTNSMTSVIASTDCNHFRHDVDEKGMERAQSTTIAKDVVAQLPKFLLFGIWIGQWS
jgi:hypothetical protein